jgi:uncharacterized protein Usg
MCEDSPSSSAACPQEAALAREIDLMVLRGFSLCTYEITYFLPDQPRILAPSLLLQKYDQDPHFPELHKFLDFWKANIEARLHSVRVASQHLIRPAEIRIASEHRLH